MQSCLTLCDPMGCRTPAFPVHHQLPELTQTHDHLHIPISLRKPILEKKRNPLNTAAKNTWVQLLKVRWETTLKQSGLKPQQFILIMTLWVWSWAVFKAGCFFPLHLAVAGVTHSPAFREWLGWARGSQKASLTSGPSAPPLVSPSPCGLSSASNVAQVI